MASPHPASVSALNFESFTVLTRHWIFQVNIMWYKPWDSTESYEERISYVTKSDLDLKLS